MKAKLKMSKMLAGSSQTVVISDIVKDVTSQVSEDGMSHSSPYGYCAEGKLLKQKVNILETKGDVWSVADVQRAFNRIVLLRDKGCKNIVQPLGYIVKSVENHIYGIVTQKFSCTLENFIFDRQSTPFRKTALTIDLKYRIASQMVNAIYMLHDLGIIHTRVQLNMFHLDKNMEVYMDGYYYSNKSERKLMNGKNFGLEGDITGLGFCLWQLFMEERHDMESSFDPQMPTSYKNQIIYGLHGDEKAEKLEELKSDERYIKLRKHISKPLEELLANSWSPYALDRLTANEFVIHLADCALIQQTGSFWATDFWVHCTRENGCVPDTTLDMDIFLPNIVSSVHVSSREVEPIKNLISKTNTISAMEFGQKLSVYGNFMTNKLTISYMKDLANAPYFFDVSKEESQFILNNKPDLTFLIRPSTTDPKFPFTISKRQNGKTIHARIEREVDTFVTTSGGKKYIGAQIPVLVYYLTEDGILGEPCPREEVNDNYG